MRVEFIDNEPFIENCGIRLFCSQGNLKEKRQLDEVYRHIGGVTFFWNSHKEEYHMRISFDKIKEVLAIFEARDCLYMINEFRISIWITSLEAKKAAQTPKERILYGN